ncbi:helicase associated domain-containing protein [Leifsonia sp. Leaf264]|uniref:helicase associated domain-containing protein n=1 Tax=Leifsonia sp. Leaf264 TaxID=1736314 RepID=UPI0006FB25A7|nr:helicase associated domain-containing protein [Leifsonia sp. Leaf264]KQO98549.1 hypothetical protein ASF30_10835 [Leifsonia sp. Leaf264]
MDFPFDSFVDQVVGAGWRETADSVAAFLGEHGHLPLSRMGAARDMPADLAAEDRLGRWVSKQREADRHGTLTDPRRAYLKSALGDLWVECAPRDHRWESKAEAVREFIDSTGRKPLTHRLPSSTLPPERAAEDKLGRWLSKQKVASNAGVLPPERAELVLELLAL